MTRDLRAIEVRDLQKSFRITEPTRRSLRSRLLHPVELARTRELRVLDGISFDVNQGEFFGVIGRNGSGKSTLIRLLASIYKADRGRIRVAGRVAPLIELGVGFDPELSARENVILNGVMLGLSPWHLRGRVDAVLDFAEVLPFRDMPLKNFSSGMQIRLAFSVLVESDADILLVDEILAVGDAGFRQKCIEVFRRMQHEGKTIVLVTHDMYDVQQHCDRVMLLENGQIETLGPPREAIRKYFEVTLQHRPSEGVVPDFWGVDGLWDDALGSNGEVRARIAKLTLTGDGDRSTDVRQGHPIEVEALVDVERPLRAAGLRMEIRTEHEARVFAPPDSSTALEVSEFKPGQRMRAQAVIENRLAPGRYTLSCAVLHSQAGEKVAASPVHAVQFEVVGAAHPGAGLVSLDHEVTIKQDRARRAGTPAGDGDGDAGARPGAGEWDFPTRERGPAPRQRVRAASAVATPATPPAAPPEGPPGGPHAPTPGPNGEPRGLRPAPFIPPVSRPGWRRWLEGVGAWLHRVADSPWFAYGSILLIQLKLIWGLWLYRDLGVGDSAAYFVGASNWANSLEVGTAYSPLYLVFYGSMEWLIDGAHAITIAHRIPLVLGASLLVLAVLRRLLPAGIAWMLALWWTLLPLHYDTLHAVHLFGILPTLVAVIVAVKWRENGLVMRSAVLSILVGTTLLVRTETAVAVGAWILIWVGYELYQRRHGDHSATPRRLAFAAAAPVATAIVVLLGLALFRAPGPYSQSLGEKQSQNYCQAYAFAYEQRQHDRVPGSAPLEACERWTIPDFGVARFTLLEGLEKNTGAMIDYFLWNGRLAPYGAQLVLFGSTSGSEGTNPDYTPDIPTGASWVLAASLGLLAFIGAGAILLWRERRRWWDRYIRDRAWGWAVMGCLLVATAFIVVTQRPRPQYLFNFNVAALAMIGMAAFVIGSRWPQLARLRAALPVAAVAILIAVPSQYDEDYTTPLTGRGEPVRTMVDRLEPFSDQLRGDETHFGAGRLADEGCIYLNGTDPCDGYDLVDLVEREPAGKTLPRLLREWGINAIYADETIATNPAIAELLRDLERQGWRRLAGEDTATEDWAFLQRSTGPASQR